MAPTPTTITPGAPADATAAALLERARRLRALAARLPVDRVDAVLARSGADTWAGPTARRFDDEVRACRRALGHAADDLRAAAARLEHEAELVARRTPSPGPR
jgi:uncharacterized protein YukE